jgi:hypothetical protein
VIRVVPLEPFPEIECEIAIQVVTSPHFFEKIFKMDRTTLKSILTLSESILSNVPEKSIDQTALISFPIYGTVVHLLQQWLELFHHLSPSTKNQLTSYYPKELEALKKGDIAQQKELVAEFVSKDLAQMVPIIQKLLVAIPLVDQVEE